MILEVKNDTLQTDFQKGCISIADFRDSKNKEINPETEIYPDTELYPEEKSPLCENDAGQERAILVGLEIDDSSPARGKDGGMAKGKSSQAERSLDELAELAKTAGAEVLHRVLQRRHAADAAYLVGKGKLEEIRQLVRSLDANLVIFDEELSAAQIRNIEDVLEVKVIDRTTLILDIFAQRARSKEGRLQVELAQLKYRLPRLTGLGGALSRLGGGIGTRGPGEKKLEIDRRHINRRIKFLERELAKVEKRRNLLRESRGRRLSPTIALVGYTNAGKSSLMNRLCKSDVFVEDKLFATLDPTVRRMDLPGGKSALLVDTVGFIRKLPHELVEAFKSTLEEAVYADMLLHVVDCSDPEAETRMEVGNRLLQELGAANKPVLIVLNKIDLVSRHDRAALGAGLGKMAFEVSAVTGEGIDRLLEAISEILDIGSIEMDLLVPYGEGWVIPFIHENGELLSSEYTDEGIKIRVNIDRAKAGRLREFMK